MKSILTISTLTFLLSFSYAQITIEPLNGCINHIISWHNTNQQTELNALEVYKEKKWYNMLPVPGVGYNFLVNRPLLTLSMPNFIAYINRKKELKYQKHKTQIMATQNITKDTVAFKSAYHQLLQSVIIYNQVVEQLPNDSLLYKMKEIENIKLQATSEELLKSKIAYLEKKVNTANLLLAIMAKVSALENHLHRSFIINYK